MSCKCAELTKINHKFTYKRKYDLYNKKTSNKNLIDIGNNTYILREHSFLTDEERNKLTEKTQEIKEYLKTAIFKCKCIHKFIDNIPIIFATTHASKRFGAPTELNGMNLSGVVAGFLFFGAIAMDVAAVLDDKTRGMYSVIAHEFMHAIDSCGACPREIPPDYVQWGYQDYHFSDKSAIIDAYNKFKADKTIFDAAQVSLVEQLEINLIKKYGVNKELIDIQKLYTGLSNLMIQKYNSYTQNPGEFYAYLNEFACPYKQPSTGVFLDAINNGGVADRLLNYSGREYMKATRKSLTASEIKGLDTCSSSKTRHPICDDLDIVVLKMKLDIAKTLDVVTREMFKKLNMDPNIVCNPYAMEPGQPVPQNCDKEQSDTINLEIKINPGKSTVTIDGENCPDYYSIDIYANNSSNFCCPNTAPSEKIWEMTGVFNLKIIQKSCFENTNEKCSLVLVPSLGTKNQFNSKEKQMINFIYNGCVFSDFNGPQFDDNDEPSITIDMVPDEVVDDFRKAIIDAVKTILPKDDSIVIVDAEGKPI